MGRKPKSERFGGSGGGKASKSKKDSDDLDEGADDFTVAGSEAGGDDGAGYLDEDDWTGNGNGEEEGGGGGGGGNFDTVDEETGEASYLTELSSCLSHAADRFDGEKSTKKREGHYKRLFKALSHCGGTDAALAVVQSNLDSLLATVAVTVKNPTYPTEQ